MARWHDGTRVEDDWLRRIGPAHVAHINFRGTLKFSVATYADALLQRVTNRWTVSTPRWCRARAEGTL